MVHIEELFAAFQTYTAAIKHACTSTQIASFEAHANKARKEFQDFCKLHNLPIDFTELE